MDVPLIDPIPAELMTLIEKEYESARAHVDRYGDIRAWEVTAALKCTYGRSSWHPLNISDMVCDKETATSMMRNALVLIATHAYYHLDDIVAADVYFEPAVRYPDEPDWDLYEHL